MKTPEPYTQPAPPPTPTVEEMRDRMQAQTEAQMRRLRKALSGRHRHRGHPGSKVPTDIRNEAKRVRSKAAKQSRRTNR